MSYTTMPDSTGDVRRRLLVSPENYVVSWWRQRHMGPAWLDRLKGPSRGHRPNVLGTSRNPSSTSRPRSSLGSSNMVEDDR